MSIFVTRRDIRVTSLENVAPSDSTFDSYRILYYTYINGIIYYIHNTYYIKYNTYYVCLQRYNIVQKYLKKYRKPCKVWYDFEFNLIRFITFITKRCRHQTILLDFGP